MKKRVYAFFGGRVQGVGFRYTVREIAAGFEVTGHVKNLPDGRVEMVAEGDASELKGFLAGIEASHLAPFIRQKAVTWAEPTGEFRTFGIAY